MGLLRDLRRRLSDWRGVDETGMGQLGFAAQYQQNVIGYQHAFLALILNINRGLGRVRA